MSAPFPHLTEEQVVKAAMLLAQRAGKPFAKFSTYFLNQVQMFVDTCAAIEGVLTEVVAASEEQKPILTNEDVLNALHAHASDLHTAREASNREVFPTQIDFQPDAWSNFCDELRATLAAKSGGPAT